MPAQHLAVLRSLGITEVILCAVLPMAFRLLASGRYTMVQLATNEPTPAGYERRDLPVRLLVRPAHPEPVLLLMPPSGDPICRHLLQTATVLSADPPEAAALLAALWPPLDAAPFPAPRSGPDGAAGDVAA